MGYGGYQEKAKGRKMITSGVKDSSKGSASFKVCLTELVIKLKRSGGKTEQKLVLLPRKEKAAPLGL